MKKEVTQEKDPQEYIDIFAKNATVFKIGEDCQVYDWRTESQNNFEYLKD